jgi:hypothetical protein
MLFVGHHGNDRRDDGPTRRSAGRDAFMAVLRQVGVLSRQRVRDGRVRDGGPGLIRPSLTTRTPTTAAMWQSGHDDHREGLV